MGLLARALESERFGLVALAWALVGYAGVFDLGLSRAVVHRVASEQNDRAAHARTLSSALLVVGVLSVVVGTLVFALREPLLRQLLRVSPAVLEDALDGFVLVALTIPLLLPTLVIQGYWDGVEDFVESNLQRALAGSLVPLLTTASVLFAPSFTSAMVGLVVARLAALSMALTRRRALSMFGARYVDFDRIRELLRFGSWITVSNTISPIMGYLDRYVLGFTRGASEVAFYAAPGDVALKLLVLPVAITRSLFPKLVEQTGQRANLTLLKESYRLIAACCVPLAFCLGLLAPWLMTVWLGAEYGEKAALPLQILLVGFVLCSFAQIPFTDIQARGRSDLTAKIHLLEVLPFLVVMLYLSNRYGAIGAAIAWTLRNLADYALLSLASRTLRA